MLDVTDSAAVRAVVEAQEPFDILVNNADMNRPGPMQALSEEDDDAVMPVIVRAVYFLTQAVVRKMLVAARGGSMINVSSQMGRVSGLDCSVYCASKHAIEGMTRALAIALGPQQIRVNTICPTFIRTPFTARTFANPELVAWIESKIKLGRIGEIEDVMGAIVFLASGAAVLITGGALMIEGGWTAG